jgi:hypothetical protein
MFDFMRLFSTILSCAQFSVVFIICFKIKNPPTLHSTSKIQPTTSPTFVFSASANVRKKWGYERKLLTDVLVVVHRIFFVLILLFHSKGVIW